MASSSTSSDLVDDLEGAFQNCIAGLITQEYFNVQDSEETKSGVEQSLNKFMDLAKQTESFFLQKRSILSKQKPEQLIKDETEELRIELERKDSLIKRHQERLQKWQQMLNSINKGQNVGTQPSSNPTQIPIPTGMPHHPQPQMIPQQSQYGPAGGMPGQTQMGLPGPTQIQAMTSSQHYHQTGQMQSQPNQSPHMLMTRPGLGHQMGPHQPPPAYPQGPLQYLEQTMSNIGMPERK